MGFSDAGAHLRNMAFYNSGLRLLRRVRDAQTGCTQHHAQRQRLHPNARQAAQRHQRPQPAIAPQQKPPGAGAGGQARFLRAGHQIARQHQEEIHPQIAPAEHIAPAKHRPQMQRQHA